MGQRRADAPGQSRASLEAHGAHGHEGTDVERAEARVRPALAPHVDARGDFPSQRDRRVTDSLRRPDEREHRAMGIDTASTWSS